MTGATPRGQGEQTQPKAIPAWPEVAGGWPSSRADRGPYADADTIDELDAVVAGQTGSAPPGAEADQDLPGAEAGQGPPGAGSGGAAAAPGADADWPVTPRRPGGPLLAWLRGEQGQAGEYLLASNSVTVGRDPASDVVLPEPSVSHEHAKIEYCEGHWWLQPADSAGPTWVNGQPVEPGQRVPVTDGDRLRFGFHTQFRLLVPSAR
jgi:hypothetical protein